MVKLFAEFALGWLAAQQREAVSELPVA